MVEQCHKQQSWEKTPTYGDLGGTLDMFMISVSTC